VALTLVQPSNAGMKPLGSTKSDADGKFRIDKEIPPGPALLQGTHQGATYNLMLAPGGPTSGVRLSVYDATNKPQASGLASHLLLIEPSTDQLHISETFLFNNTGTLTFADSAKGTVQFFVPDAAVDSVRVTINAPGGMPIQRPAEKTSQKSIYKITYPVKAGGESRFDVEYHLPAATEFAGKSVLAGMPMRIVTPPSVTISGAGIEEQGQEPETKVHLYKVAGSEFAVKIEGTGSIREAQPPTAGAAPPPDEDNGSPQLEIHTPRIYTRLALVLTLTFAILAFGGIVLYRRGRV
jgi:hypothetical protein